MFNIYRLLLTLLHITWTIITVLKDTWAELRRRYQETIEFYHAGKNNDNQNIRKLEPEYLIRSVTRIQKTSKLPNHLVLILGRETPSFTDIIRVIGWCATAGIPCVSFYDHTGLLRKSENEARIELTRLRPELLDSINWNSACPVKAVRNGINGTKHKMHVQLLSHSDGKREVALLAQSLGKGVVTGALKIEEVGPELLENKLELGGLPDPDLAIICGKTCSTFGLLPWHIRTTEFLLTESHRNIKVTEFVHLLEKFAKCEQRYGK